jgi:pantothenate kinase type III
VLGLFDGDRLVADWRIATRKGETADELGALFRVAGERLEPSAVDGVIVSSVVPDWNGILARQRDARSTGSAVRHSGDQDRLRSVREPP